MTGKTRQAEQRAASLSKARIVEAAIRLLDGGGEDALTFRALATSLQTGSGAIYWHVADKGELLAAAADHIVVRAMAGTSRDAEPRAAIRAIALGVFDAVDAHPWVGAQFAREPWRPAMTQVFEGIGGGLLALGVPERSQFDVWSALVNYILGVATQNAANARSAPPGTDRAAILATTAAGWAKLGSTEYPFMSSISAQMAEHDDREQFLSGVDLILAGIQNLR